MRATHLKKDKCPACNKGLDCASSLDPDEVPRPKDISICIYCGTLLQYGNDMTLQLLPIFIFETLPIKTQQQLLQAKSAITKIK